MPADARLVVRLTPRAGRDAIEGWTRDDKGRPMLKVRVGAAPVNEAANQALIALIAKRLRRSPRSIRIVGGDHGRVKHVEIEGAADADLIAAFGAPPP